MGMGKRDWMPVPVLAALCVAMMFAPTAERVVSDGGETVRARVVSVDDSKLVYTGLVRYGTQYLEVEVVSGPAAGTRPRRAAAQRGTARPPGTAATAPRPPRAARRPRPRRPPAPRISTTSSGPA